MTPPGPVLRSATPIQLAAARQHQRFNAWCSASQTYQVSKMSNKPRARGTRRLHVLLPFGEEHAWRLDKRPPRHRWATQSPAMLERDRVLMLLRSGSHYT
eukprot:236418-Pyramimonas_sp.AAC.1